MVSRAISERYMKSIQYKSFESSLEITYSSTLKLKKLTINNDIIPQSKKTTIFHPIMIKNIKIL